MNSIETTLNNGKTQMTVLSPVTGHQFSAKISRALWLVFRATILHPGAQITDDRLAQQFSKMQCHSRRGQSDSANAQQ
jgi:hypothetical protein